MKKRILGIITAIVMMLSVCNLTSIYAETRATEGPVDSVAKIGDTEYTTLQEAISNATSGSTITLLKDTQENVEISSEKNVILDLNGKKISGGTVKSKAAINNLGTVVIKDSVGTGFVERGDTGYPAYYVIENNGTMTIMSGNFSNDSGTTDKWAGSSLVCNGNKSDAHLIIEGGTFQQNKFIALKNDDHGTLEFRGGKVTSLGSGSSAIQNWNDLTITGGEVNGDITTWAWSDSFGPGSTTIKGDVVVNGRVYLDKDGSPSVKPVVNIEGGKFKNNFSFYTATNDFQLSVSGGEFSADPTKYLAIGYETYKLTDGTYKVASKVSNVTLSSEKESIEVGKTVTLTVTATPVEALNTVTWESSDLKVATVDATGKVTAVATGTATITAKAKDKSAICAVTVYKVETPDITTPTTPITGNEQATVAVDKESAAVIIDSIKDIVANVETTTSISTATKEALKTAITEGKTISIKPEVKAITENTIDKETLTKIEEKLGTKEAVAQYFELSMMLTADGSPLGTLNELTGKVSFTVTIDKSLIKEGRAFYMIRVHEDGSIEKIEGTLKGDQFTFETDKFSTFALVHDDTKVVPTKNENTKVDTGDTTNTTTLVTLMGISILAIGAISLRKKFNKE